MTFRPLQTRRHVDDDLKAYVDGELGTIRRTMIMRHLARCEACRIKEQEMRRITEQLNGWGSAKNAALSPDLRATLLARGPAERSGDAPAHRPLWQRSPGLVFGGGGLSLAASLAAFSFLYSTANQATNSDVAVASAPSAARVAGSEAAAVTSNTDSSAMPAFGSAPQAAPEAVPAADAMEKSGDTQNADALRAVTRPAGSAPTTAAKPFAGALANGNVVSRNVVSRQVAQGFRRDTAALGFSAESDSNGSLSGLATRQVHREASLGVAVDSPEAASAKIETLVKEWGGYVASNVLTTDATGYKSAEMTLKVPEERFDEMLGSLAKMGDVRSKSITGEDVTEQTSDATSDEQVLLDETEKLEKRLQSQSLSERRTQQTEAQLRQVRQDLARTRARLGLLRKLARLSTLSVTLTEKAKLGVALTAQPTTGFWADMKDSNRAALKAFLAAVRVPLLLVIWAAALSPLWLPMLLVYRHLSRKQAADLGARAAATETAAPPADLDR